MLNDLTIAALVARAQQGDQSAWDELVERYAPLIWAVCRRHRLSRRDVDDVAQTVWLRLVERLGTLREPAALPGWLATTTQRECLCVLRAAHKREHNERALDFDMATAGNASLLEQEVLAAELNAALLSAFAQLPETCRRLLALVVHKVPYEQISERMDMAIGSIGPTRARCLARLRRAPALAAFRETDAEAAAGDRYA